MRTDQVSTLYLFVTFHVLLNRVNTPPQVLRRDKVTLRATCLI
jgi:hypothetical protein